MNGSKSMVHLHSGLLRSRKKEGALTICDCMDGTGEHYAKWNKPGSEGHIPCDLTFKWKLINKTNKQAKCHQRHWNWEQADNDQRGERRDNGGKAWNVTWTIIKDTWTITRRGGNRGRRWGGLGLWGGVGRKGRKLYLHNNKKRVKKCLEELIVIFENSCKSVL